MRESQTNLLNYVQNKMQQFFVAGVLAHVAEETQGLLR